MMAAALPVALHRNQAVEGALVVVCRCERVSNLPEVDRGAHYLPSETQQLRVRASGSARKICERDLDDAESMRVRLDQDFLEHFEVGAIKIEILERVAAVKAISTGEIAHRHREHPAQHAVHKPAGRAPDKGGVGDAAPHIPRRNHAVPAPPRSPPIYPKTRTLPF